jgi:hypothetical protein
MLHARNNVSPARYCRVTYLALAGGLPSGAQNKPNARWFGCLQNPVRAVVLLPGKQHKWKGAQEVRNGSKADLAALKFDFRYTSESRHHADMSACPKSANRRQCSATIEI